MQPILSLNKNGWLPWQQGSTWEKYLTPSNKPGPKIKGRGRCKQRGELQGPSYSQFCPKIRCHGNGGQQERNLNDTIG